ncbi:MAG: hypothetical protein JNL60_15310, partial [Bacteroidia bacterium]|nr:hypothetical protein [Bacteroidia bacterium]
PATCSKYDQIFQLTRTEVDMFVKNGATPSSNITQWPGNGDVSMKQGKRLAPFVDVDFDGVYDPIASKDYPAYDVYDRAETDALGVCKAKLFGDYTLFWVFNDNGGVHTETQGVPLGVEVRAQAFAFKTNDEINNMTFYSYEVFNRSSFQLNKTYFSVWTDADLGYFLDDYVGCDVKKGLGYIYNADPFDETAMGANGYGDYPPALGCDFFRGPLADVGDGIDNDMDGVKDEAGETIQMSRFTYYNNNYGAFPPQTTNPAIAVHYYNYMTGFWKDSSPFTQGGNAYGGTSPSTFIYDGNPVTNTGWTERGSGNTPGDRRFIQSAGPFTLKPGAVNEITFGCPWAQSSSKGGNLQSLELLFNADVKAQALFDNCFKLLDGPEAPNMTIQEMENELIVYLTNEKGTNNYRQFNNDYAEEDVTITSDPSSSIPGLRNPDKTYRFEGYIVYQVVDDKVTSNDLDDKTKARQIFQCDLANGVTRLINYEQDNVLGAEVPTLKVDGADQGITTTFRITEDVFSTLENRKLVNNKQYYFIAVAYAYNQYLKYKPDQPVNNADPNQTENSMGQKRPYLEGRKSKRASATPHNTDMEKGGTLANSAYGFGPKITRIEGQGNGGNILTLTQESEDAIVKDYFREQITYENAQGPISIKVVDPLNVKDSEFSFRFINSKMDSLTPTESKNAMSKTPKGDTLKGTMGTLNIETTSWELKDLHTGKIYRANDIATIHDPKDVYYQTIKVGNEFYFQELGFSVTVKQVSDPGERVNRYIDYTRTSLTIDSIYKPEPNAFLGARIAYTGGAANWLNSVVDQEGYTPFNWILSGSNKTDDQEDAYFKKVETDAAFYDPDKQFAKILGGTWAPYALCASYYSVTPGPTNVSPTRIFAGPAFNAKIWNLDRNFLNIYNGQQHQGGASPGPAQGNTDLRKLSSTVIVFTRDKSKWTRCVVLEMQEKSDLSEGNAVYFQPRKHLSVDKNGVAYGSPGATGDAATTSTMSMGWFPGYAINIETGERLNM